MVLNLKKIKIDLYISYIDFNAYVKIILNLIYFLLIDNDYQSQFISRDINFKLYYICNY